MLQSCGLNARLLFPILLATAALAAPKLQAAQPATTASDKPESLAQRRLDAQAQVDDQMRGLTSLGRQDLRDVIAFTIRGTKLAVSTSMPATGTDFDEVKIRQLPGQSRIRVQYLDPQHAIPGDSRRFIQMEYFLLHAPGIVFIHDEFLSDPDLLNISEDLDYNDGSARSVQLVQAAADGPQAVKLYVQDFPPNDQGKLTKFELAAPSVTSMCWQNPRQTNDYLRPIFRRLDQEAAVFAVSRRAAWQVVAADDHPDPDTVAATNAIIANLGAESFSQRERAAADLRKLGQAAAIYLMNDPPANLSLEQEMRVDLFLVPYRPLSPADAQRLANDKTFLIDCLYNNDPALRRLIVNRLENITGRHIDFHPPPQSPDAAVAALFDQLIGPATRPAATQKDSQ